VFAIAPSGIQRGLIWAGTNDGQIWVTRDAGAAWTNVSKNVGMPAWGTIRKIEPSHFDPGTAYVAVDYHMMDDRRPYLYKTTDFGQTWTRLSDALPNDHPLSYVMSVAENPNKRGMLFAGTGHAFFYSLDDGTHWTQFKEGLPAAPVTWIVVPKKWHDVVISTYGRGIYILRDIAPLEEGPGAQLAAAGARLYTPHPGYRQARSGHADITFSLSAVDRAPARVQVLDSTGAVIRTIAQPARVGLNRVNWDLRYDAPKRVDLRTTPDANPHIWEEPRFRGKVVRPITHWGIQGPESTGPLGVPGRYAVRVIVGKDTTPSQPLEVLRDPQITGSDADLLASTQTQIRIRDDMNAAAEMINKLEIVRRQIEDQRKTLTSAGDVSSALAQMDAKLLGVELRLVSKSDLNSDDKYYVEPYKVYLNLIWLSGEVGTGAGDVAGGADSRPTDTSLEVLAQIESDLSAAKAEYAKVMTEDVPAFNKAMSGKVTALTAIAGAAR
jgi:hypothetical protein